MRAMSVRAVGFAVLVLAVAACGRGIGNPDNTGVSEPSPPARGEAAHAVPANPANPAATSQARLPPIPQRRGHSTKLLRKGPSPQDEPPLRPEGPLKVVRYRSGALTLQAYLLTPANASLKTAAGYPVLLYLHGGFALGAQDVLDCTAFTDAGFAILAPALRGENGNPGYFEFAYGELDDARAALAMVAAIGDLDAKRVVVFGHSAGGMLSSLMALYPDLPALYTGSIGGFYSGDIFEAMGKPPFEDSDTERIMRLSAYHAAEFKHPHFACVGELDEWPRAVAAEAAKASSQITMYAVPGDHFASVAPCMNAYLKHVVPLVR